MTLKRIDFNVHGAAMYSRAFEVFGREADDLREPFQDVAEIIRDSVGAQFQSEGAHGLGHRWQPLNAAYAAWKEANYGPLPMLVRTGDMRGAALSRSAFTITPQRLVYEVDDDKALTHQEGKGHMPQRQIVALSGADRRELDHAFAAWLNGLRRGIIGRAA